MSFVNFKLFKNILSIFKPQIIPCNLQNEQDNFWSLILKYPLQLTKINKIVKYLVWADLLRITEKVIN